MSIYYHINNNPNCNWTSGQVIEFGVQDNYMWESYSKMGDFIELSGGRFSSDIIIRHALDTYTRTYPPPEGMKDYHFNPIFTLKEAADSLGNSMRMIRELAFEAIRKEFYPELPSRHSCVWLIPDDSQSFEFWKNVLHRKSQRIFKVVADGKIHRAAQKWLVGGTIPLNEINSMAHKYWRGDDVGSFEDEVLFEGKLTILEEVDK